MTKKQYCLNNEAVACHTYYRMQIHGIEYGVNDYAYISRIYQKSVCGESHVSFHKVKISYDMDGNGYITIVERYFDGRKHKLVLSMNDFIRCDSPWGMSGITCAELKAFA